jgi:hypothetical protein
MTPIFTLKAANALTPIPAQPSTNSKVKNVTPKPAGAALSWERLDEKKASRIRYVIKEGGITDESKWPAIQDAMTSAMDRLAKAIKPHFSRA